MKKILLLEWNSFGNDFVRNAFSGYGYEVVKMPVDFDTEDIYTSDVIKGSVADSVEKIRPDFVFSFNFYPIVAVTCHEKDIRYVSWTYDSPSVHLFAKETGFDTNRIFVFDQSDALELQELGVKNAYYLPLGCGVSWYDRLIPGKKEYSRYGCDVAFIGQTYAEDKYHLYEGFDRLPDYVLGSIDGLIHAQKNIYGANYLTDVLTDEVAEAIRKVFPYRSKEGCLKDEKWVLAQYLLSRKVTALERTQILSSLAESFTVRIYTSEKTGLPQGLINMGWIDYYNDAPMAIKSAKVNLNISLKSIRSGIPLRVMDIFGCGGFLISNFQSDMLECFVPGEDFVMYESAEEVEELVAYYLQHDPERKQIAENGHQKAASQMSWEIQTGKLLKMI